MNSQPETYDPGQYALAHPANPPASLPAALGDVALIDGYTCAAAGAMSISQWHELVRQKLAPQPAIREPRFTRWRVIDVRSYLEQRIRSAQAGSEAAGAVIAKAAKASVAARAKRGAGVHQ